jgi:hypothetical protein
MQVCLSGPSPCIRTDDFGGHIDTRAFADDLPNTVKFITWADTLVSKIKPDLPFGAEMPVTLGKSVTLESGEKAFVSSHVILSVCLLFNNASYTHL